MHSKIPILGCGCALCGFWVNAYEIKYNNMSSTYTLYEWMRKQEGNAYVEKNEGTS